MAQHLDIHASRWQKEGGPAISRVVVGIWGGIIIGTLGLVILAANFTFKGHVVQKSEKVEKPVKAETYAIPSFEGAKTIFVVVDKPSQELLSALETAFQSGSKVQLITTEPVTASFNVTVVDPKRVIRNAVLINGASWYPLSP